MKKGFTLVEVMLSAAILSIGLVLILQAFAQSLNGLRISKDNLTATLVAGNKMAEAEIQAKEDWDAFEKGSNERFESEGISYQWQAEVNPVDAKTDEMYEENDVLNEVKASLSWEEGKRKGVISLVTFMKKYAEE